MSFLENQFLKSRQYIPATLKKTASRGWHIEYSILDSETNKVSRKFIGLNCLAKRFKSEPRTFKAHANTLVAQINMQLAQCVLSVNDSAVERVHQNVMFVGKMNNKPTVMMVVPQQEQVSTCETSGWFAPIAIAGEVVVKEQPKQKVVKQEVKQNETIPEKKEKLSSETTELPRSQTSLQKVIDLYIAEKSRELRKDSVSSYVSFCKKFSEWCEKNSSFSVMSEFDNETIMCYMDYVYNERQVSARTYNNQVKMGRALFSWAKEKCYAKENPFENVKTKRAGEKKRILVPAEVRQKIAEYYERKKPAMLTVCRLVYASAIRPKEILNIKVGDVLLAKKAIYIPAENAKNSHARYASMNNQILDDLLAMNLDQYPPEYYLFGEGFKPGKNIGSSACFRKSWDKMRKALNLPQEMQLYSLRDTGLNNLLKNGVDALTVMQHADHHDLSMTTRYANHADPNLAEKIFNSSVEF